MSVGRNLHSGLVGPVVVVVVVATESARRFAISAICSLYPPVAGLAPGAVLGGEEVCSETCLVAISVTAGAGVAVAGPGRDRHIVDCAHLLGGRTGVRSWPVERPCRPTGLGIRCFLRAPATAATG